MAVTVAVTPVTFADDVREAIQFVYGDVTPDDVPPTARAEVALAKDPARLHEAAVVADRRLIKRAVHW